MSQLIPYAILDDQGRCVSRCLWDGQTSWEPPSGHTAVPDPSGQYNPGSSETPSIPESVSARQIRLWLINNGFELSQVENAINSIEDTITRETVKIEWEYAPYVERSHPMLIPLAQALGLTENQVDQAFIQAQYI